MEGGGDYKKAQRNLGGDGNVHCLHCGDNSQMCSYVKTGFTVHFTYAQYIVCQLHFKKTISTLLASR